MKSTDPLVSVIIPVYNAEKYVSEAILSILDQSYKNLQVLICDDASIDNSVDKIQSIKDSRILFLQNKKNIGSLLTRNQLFKLCSGEFIAFMDADDRCSQNKIHNQVDVFLSDPDLGILGTNAYYFNRHGKTVRLKNLFETDWDIKAHIFRGNPFCSASVMVRRGVLNEVGGYRMFFKDIGNYDYDWTSRIVQRYKSRNLQDFLYGVRLLKNSNSKRVMRKSHRSFLSSRIVRHLSKQREKYGTDDLENDTAELEEFIKKIEIPYIEDPSLVFRELAASNVYNGNYREAIFDALRSMRITPNFTNFSTFAYCVKRLLNIGLY